MFFTSCKILQYKKNDVSEGIDVNKTNALKECMLYRYWYFKDARFKVEPHVCYKCHDILITAYEFKNVVILNVKRVDFRCTLWGISKNEAVNRLNNPVLEDQGVLQMDCGTNKRSSEVIEEGGFRGT